MVRYCMDVMGTRHVVMAGTNLHVKDTVPI